MKPYTDIEAGRQLMLYGTVFTMARRNAEGTFELFILEREEFLIKELQNDKPRS